MEWNVTSHDGKGSAGAREHLRSAFRTAGSRAYAFAVAQGFTPRQAEAAVVAAFADYWSEAAWTECAGDEARTRRWVLARTHGYLQGEGQGHSQGRLAGSHGINGGERNTDTDPGFRELARLVADQMGKDGS